MELSESTLRGLSLLGEEAKIPAPAFKDLLIVAFKDAASNLNTAISNLSEFPTLEKLDRAILKEAYSAALIFIFEAAKVNLDEPGVVAILEDTKVDQKRVELFTKMYEAKKNEVRILLGSTTVGYPHLVDINWRLDYFIKSRRLDRVDQLVYMVGLKAEDTDGQAKDIFFSATVEELQDLVNKLKDAQKSLHTIQG